MEKCKELEVKSRKGELDLLPGCNMPQTLESEARTFSALALANTLVRRKPKPGGFPHSKVSSRWPSTLPASLLQAIHTASVLMYLRGGSVLMYLAGGLYGNFSLQANFHARR